jgi:hypothetical protein
MYGAEYQADNTHSSLLFGDNLLSFDVPCAVCRVTSRATVLMIPARNECYDGWTREYAGYLMAGTWNGLSAASQYVCVDAAPETLEGRVNDDDGLKNKLFNLVEGICGSLKCPPYVGGRELTCVVCTK